MSNSWQYAAATAQEHGNWPNATPRKVPEDLASHKEAVTLRRDVAMWRTIGDISIAAP